MPVQRRYDFQIGGKGFMLARGEYQGRAWTRTGRADSPGERGQTDAKYGVLEDELDHPDVWDDWSGGYGYAYRKTDDNTYHWAENMDCRFPRQMVHCQAPHIFSGDPTVTTVATDINAEQFLDLPYPAGSSWTQQVGGGPGVGQPGQGAVLVMGQGYALSVVPRDPAGITVEASMFWIPARLPFLVGSVNYGGSLNYGYQAALFDSYIWLPNLSGTEFLRGHNKEISAVTTNSSNMLARNFLNVGNSLWRASGPTGRRNRFLQHTISDPRVAANWSATLSIGNGELPITTLMALNDQVFAGMPDGIYAGDATGTFVNVLGELANQIHEDNCRDLTVYQGGIVVPHVAGLFWYRQSDYSALVEDISPPLLRSDRSPIQGQIRTVRSFGPWVYGGVSTGSQSYLLAGRPGAGGWAWHPLNRLPHLGRIHRLHFDGISRAYDTSGMAAVIPNRIWVAMNASINTLGTAPIYYWPIPSVNGNPLTPLMGFSANYVGSARIDLGSTDWGAPGTPKLYRSLEVWADNLASAAQWCNLYYSIDAEGTRHLLGTVAKSPKDSLYFSSGEGSFVTGQSIELSLESFTASAAITPVYRSIVLRGALQPRSVDMITAVVRVADELRDRQGGTMRSGSTMLDDLRAFGDPDRQGLQAHQMIDLAGATAWVKVVGRVEEREMYQRGEDDPEIAATVRLAVLSFSGG